MKILQILAYILSVANNGGGYGPEYTLSGSANAGDDILVELEVMIIQQTFFLNILRLYELTITVLMEGDDPVELD